MAGNVTRRETLTAGSEVDVFSSAGQIAQAVRAGHVSAVAVAEAALAQVARVNGTLDAVVSLNPKRA